MGKRKNLYCPDERDVSWKVKSIKKGAKLNTALHKKGNVASDEGVFCPVSEKNE